MSLSVVVGLHRQLIQYIVNQAAKNTASELILTRK